MQPFFPVTANVYIVFSVFAFFLLILDLTLVRWLKISKSKWRIVEYIWLGFTALSLFSAVAQVRILAANNQTGTFQQHVTFNLSNLRGSAAQYATVPGAICRTFVRSEYSPPPEEFERVQREYDEACEWFKRSLVALPRDFSSPPPSITAESLPNRPHYSSADLSDIIDNFYKQIDFYNQDAKELEKLLSAQKSTPLESIFLGLWPFILAVALALRITKVTGETHV